MLHQKTDIDCGLIREIETTTAKAHDSQVDLSAEGEIVLRDRGYFEELRGYWLQRSGEFVS